MSMHFPLKAVLYCCRMRVINLAVSQPVLSLNGNFRHLYGRAATVTILYSRPKLLRLSLTCNKLTLFDCWMNCTVAPKKNETRAQRFLIFKSFIPVASSQLRRLVMETRARSGEAVTG